MSKSLKNYPDPTLIVNQYGADAMRFVGPLAVPDIYIHDAIPRMYLVNSPVVRAEVLKFREEGVRDVVSRVLLPWLNSFRFFLGQAALFQKDYGEVFQYDAHAKQSDNVMDRWILARCQSLIKLVREEMAGMNTSTSMKTQHF